jgi:2-polyprenyl-3-methyl-5-hydroxy-6-metoxy-1,4-benzoquinol methylase
MTPGEPIRTEEATHCPSCGQPGYPKYRGMEDRLFQAPGVWNLFRCDSCNLLWLNPRPAADDIAKCYRDYHTHVEASVPRFADLRRRLRNSALRRHFGYLHLDDPHFGFFLRLLTTVGPLRVRVAWRIMFLSWLPNGNKLLDVGCGRGDYLALMKELGWKVSGVEPDPVAARLARQRLAADVRVGTLEEAGFPGSSFDAVTMGHVIEHVVHPLQTLKRCFELLRPGGRLAVIAPNISSLGHKLYGRSWRGLEPPRHLVLFSPAALKQAVERVGFRVLYLGTSGRSAAEIEVMSRQIRRTNHANLNSSPALRGRALVLLEEAGALGGGLWGEEIGLVAEKVPELESRGNSSALSGEK